MPEPDIDPFVLLLGGASNTGKSTLAGQFRHAFGWTTIDTDLFFIVLQRESPAPELQAILQDAVEGCTAEELARRHFEASRYMCSAIEIVIDHCRTRSGPVIIEGAWLLPDFVAAKAAEARGMPVKALFLNEPDTGMSPYALYPERIPPEMTPATSAAWARAHHLYGLEIRRQADELGLPVLEARPYATAMARALGLLGQSPS